jgi:hypothetical protein
MGEVARGFTPRVHTPERFNMVEWWSANTAGPWLAKAWLHWRVKAWLHWRVLSAIVVSLIYSQRCSRQIVRDDIPIQIHLPEGVYDATATFERFVWSRPLRISTRTKLYTKVDLPDGIPYIRNGEQYSFYEYSVEGHDLNRAIARGEEIALKGRRQNHGMFLSPSMSSM